MVDVAEQGFCPHCLGETGLLVRGDPKYAITRDGLRYWFPDPAHRDAFLAANPTACARPRPPMAPPPRSPAAEVATESGRRRRRNHGSHELHTKRAREAATGVRSL